MRKIRTLLLMAVPVLLLSCGDGTNRNTDNTDDTRGNREYNRENDMDNDMDNTRENDMDRGTYQGAEPDTVSQDL
jgi:hypothetical protein